MNLQIKKLLNVFVVEDLLVVRESLQIMLSEICGVAIVGFAVGEAVAIESIDLLLPDVVVLDLHLRQGTGIKVLEHVKKYHAKTKVIVLSNCSNESYTSRCKRAKADYFFDKSFQFMLVGKVLEQLMSPDGAGGGIAGLQ